MLDSDSLRLTVSHDDDGTTELLAQVEANGFAGRGSAWFNVSELLSFAALLTAFPLPAVEPRSIAGGFWDENKNGVLTQTHLSIRIYPVGGRGQLAARVLLASPVNTHDRPESQQSVAVELLTSYSALGAFATQLTQVLLSGQGEAVLSGERLA